MGRVGLCTPGDRVGICSKGVTTGCAEVRVGEIITFEEVVTTFGGDTVTELVVSITHAVEGVVITLDSAEVAVVVLDTVDDASKGATTEGA